MIPSDPRPKNHRKATRRCCAVGLLVAVSAACGASDDTTQETSPTTVSTTAQLATDPPTTTTPAPSSDVETTTTVAPSTSTTNATTTTSSTTTAPSTTTGTEPASAPEQSIPEAVQGMWRISDAASVGVDDCRQDRGFEGNFGQVLTVRADGFTYFESGGTLIEVIERDESRVDATFETTSGGPTTMEERITLDAQDDATVLIVNDAQPGILRLVRCPPPTEPSTTGAEAGPLELEPFDLARVRDAGIESIGCSMRPGSEGDLGTIFFANGEGGFMVIDGESITLSNSTSPDDGVIPNIEADLTYSENGYAATFAAVGEETPDSIESTQQPVTLAVSTPDGRRTRIDGVISCGV